MYQPRERYNAKARQSTAGPSHKKGKKKSLSGSKSDPASSDPNAAIHVPKTKDDKDLDRKEKLRQEVSKDHFHR